MSLPGTGTFGCWLWIWLSTPGKTCQWPLGNSTVANILHTPSSRTLPWIENVVFLRPFTGTALQCCGGYVLLAS